MLKINLLTNEIKPFIKEKSTPIKVNVKKIVLIAASILLVLGVSAYFIGQIFLSTMQKSDPTYKQDNAVNMPNPEEYKDEEAKKEEKEIVESDEKVIADRKETEELAIDPKEEYKPKKSSELAFSKKSKPREIPKRKYAPKPKKRKSTASKPKLTTKRVKSFIANEHATPKLLMAAIEGISGIETIRLNNPQTLYLEVDPGRVDEIKNKIKSKGLSVNKIKLKSGTNLEVFHDKSTGTPTLASITSVPEIEARVSQTIRGFGGYPISKDSNKPIGKYFSFSVKYTVPAIDFKKTVKLLNSIQQEYDGIGVSKIVYDVSKRSLKLDINIYAR